MKSCNFAAIKLLIGTSLLSTTFYCSSSEVIYPIKFGANTDKTLVSDSQEKTGQAVQETELVSQMEETTAVAETPFSDRKVDSAKQANSRTNKEGSFKVGVHGNGTQENRSESSSARQENTELDKDSSTQRTADQATPTGEVKPGKQVGLVATGSLDKDVNSISYTYSDRDVTYGARDLSTNGLSQSNTQSSDPSISAKSQSGKKTAHRGNVTLRDTVNLVLNWHPVIKRSESELQQYEEYIDEAKSAYYPSVSVGVKSGFEENQYYGGNDRSSKVVVNGSQMLYDFGKTRNKVELAESTSVRSASGLHKTINDLVYESAAAYLQVVRYTNLVDIAEKQVIGFRAINEIAKKRSNLGASAESDYSQAKVRLASAESSLYDYQAQLHRWSSILNNLTNQDVAAKLKLSFPDDIYGVCGKINIKNFSSPGIEMAEAQVEMAKSQVAAAKADYFPTISVNPTYEYELEDESNTSRNRKKSQFGVFINVSASLYEGGATTSRSKQADQALNAAKFNLETEKTEAKRKIIEATSQIQSTQSSLKAKEQREVEAIRTRDLYKLQYVELGSRSFSDLLSAESEIHQTRMDIVNSYFTISNFSIECLYQSGMLAKTLANSSQVK